MTVPILPTFQAWPKTTRLSKTTMLITEKIDGTNACVGVTEGGYVFAQSRNRLITADADNFGFAAWVFEHADELEQLGPGYHYGEWWGLGIGRGYGLDKKRFSLFDANRWKHPDGVPACCGVVPVLARCSPFDLSGWLDDQLAFLRRTGSVAAPGFERPEGICVTHDRRTYKVLLENDDIHKSQVAA